jgi:Ca2+:H+ antiporter
VFVPVAIALHYFLPRHGAIVFGAACLAIVPLAGWLGKATEHLAARTSEAIGGLLNATFGNAAELIIGLMAISRGLYPIAKASITGSIIGNLLLVFGASALAGGTRHKQQHFSAFAARTQATLLILAAIALLAPAVFYQITGAKGRAGETNLSLAISIVLLIIYGLNLLFSLGTHRQLYAAEQPADEEHEAAPWPLKRSLAALAGATALTAWVSEILVDSVNEAAQHFGMSDLFVGVVVIAIIGNAAEHSTCLTAALKNRMDLALSIAIGSSIQIALLVAPLLVVASYFVGPQPMDLLFTMGEVMAVVVAVAITAQIAGDGETHWLEGAQLLAVYLIVGFLFYFLPA